MPVVNIFLEVCYIHTASLSGKPTIESELLDSSTTIILVFSPLILQTFVFYIDLQCVVDTCGICYIFFSQQCRGLNQGSYSC